MAMAVFCANGTLADDSAPDDGSDFGQESVSEEPRIKIFFGKLVDKITPRFLEEDEDGGDEDGGDIENIDAQSEWSNPDHSPRIVQSVSKPAVKMDFASGAAMQHLPKRKPALPEDFEVQAIQTLGADVENIADQTGDAHLVETIRHVANIATPQDQKFSAEQAHLYKEIFAAQSRGNMSEADQLFRQLTDERLLGHVLYQRYMHPTAYRSSFEELKYWLDIYADYPGADQIYKMAVQRKPSDFSGSVRRPKKTSGVPHTHEQTIDRAKIYVSAINRNTAQAQKAHRTQKKIRRLLAKGAPTQALATLKTVMGARVFDEPEIQILKSYIAASYLYSGKKKDAWNLAHNASDTAPKEAPLAAWIAGLVAWDMKKYETSAQYFKTAAESEYASGWMRSASSFWAARSLMRSGQVKEVTQWLEKAYEHPHTFYGLLAMQALGKKSDYNWKVPNFTKEYFDHMHRVPGARRAMALVAAGQSEMAEKELLALPVRGDKALQNAVLAYANYADLPRLAMRLGNHLSRPDERLFFEAALYPKSSWAPTNGFQVDPALVHAIMRQESKFDPHAKSGSGASGLMQIMPATAFYTAKTYKYKLSGARDLTNPQVNLDIGQLYLQHLLKKPDIKGNVIKLLIAYNAGPGNLRRWEKQIEYQDDPLFFIEMLPVAETRSYVEKVLANYWMYRFKEMKDVKSLNNLAEGHWAYYANDNKPVTVALRP